MPTSTAPAVSRGRQAGPIGRVLSGVSVWWLVAVAAAFTLAQLLFVVPKLGLSWDEIVYVSQVSTHAPASIFGPPRARGISLIVAPVAGLTSSVLAMRVYLAFLSGTGLLLAMLVWRRLRPAWTVALAGVFFASLWVTQYYGPQAMPDLWVALSAIAAVGFFLQAADAAQPDAAQPDAEGPVGRGQRQARRSERSWGALAGLAGSLAIAALVRPGDAVFLGAGLVASVLVVAKWRQWRLIVTTALGVLAGSAEWIIEAFVRFGGPLRRLQGASQEQGGFGLHPGILYQLHALNGPTACRPCAPTMGSPGLSLWWLALPVVVVLGIAAARQAGRLGSALLPAVAAFCIGFQYLFLIDYAAPRFLLPVYGLLAIPVADAMSWLASPARRDLRPLTVAAAGVLLVAQIATQHVVLDRQVAAKVRFFDGYARIAADLHQLGVRPPCTVNGVQEIPIAFYAGCGSAVNIGAALRPGRRPIGRVAVLIRPGATPPWYARDWRRVSLRGLSRGQLVLVAYIPRG